MKKAVARLAMMALMASAMGEGYYGHGSTQSNDDVLSRKPKKQPIPKGCKEYFFTKRGFWDNTTKDDNYYFKCIASSEKVAIKKFNKFKIKHKS